MASSSSPPKRKQDEISQELEKPPQPKARAKKKDKAVVAIKQFKSLLNWKKLHKILTDEIALVCREPEESVNLKNEYILLYALQHQLLNACKRVINDPENQFLDNFAGFKKGDIVIPTMEWSLPDKHSSMTEAAIAIDYADLPVAFREDPYFPEEKSHYFFRVLDQFDPVDSHHDVYMTLSKQMFGEERLPNIGRIVSPSFQFRYKPSLHEVSALPFSVSTMYVVGNTWKLFPFKSFRPRDPDDGKLIPRAQMAQLPVAGFMSNFFQRKPTLTMKGIPWEELVSIKDKIYAVLPTDVAGIVTQYDSRLNDPLIRAAKELAMPQAFLV